MIFALLIACSSATTETPSPDVPTLTPPSADEGFQMAMRGSAPAFSETWLCSVYDLTTEDLSNVNRVEYVGNAGTHHMTVSTTALSTTRLDAGVYDCNDLYSGSSLMQDAVMMFGSQGAAEGQIALPTGVVAQVPAGIQVVHELHYVNATADEVPLYSYLNAWTIPEDEVTDTIWGGQVRDEVLELPPQQVTTEWTRCVMNEDVEVHFLASHTHARATAFTIAPFDGSAAGAIFYENDDWHDPKITQYDPPLVVPAGTGFEYACTYDNRSDEAVYYGLGADDEMCNLTLVYTPGSRSAECVVVATSDGQVP